MEIFEHAELFATRQLAKQLKKIVHMHKGLREKRLDLYWEMKKQIEKKATHSATYNLKA